MHASTIVIITKNVITKMMISGTTMVRIQPGMPPSLSLPGNKKIMNTIFSYIHYCTYRLVLIR